MNQVNILLQFAICEKNADLQLKHAIKACRILSSILPNDLQRFQIQDKLSDVFPKLIKLYPILPTSVGMLMKAIVTRFKDSFCEQLCDILVKPLFQQYTADSVKQKSKEILLHLIQQVSFQQVERMQPLFKPILSSQAISQSLKEQLAQGVKERLGFAIDRVIFREFLNTEEDKPLCAESEESKEESSLLVQFKLDNQIKHRLEILQQNMKEVNIVEQLERGLSNFHEEPAFTTKRKAFLQFVLKSRNLESLVRTISNPHNHHVKAEWPISRSIQLCSFEVIQAYINEWKEHPLVLVAASKFDGSIQSINSNVELSQIYRSYLALKVLINPQNFTLMQKPVQNLGHRIFMAALDAFMQNIRPCFLHIYQLIAFTLIKDPFQISKDAIRNGLIIKVMGFIDIPASHDFLVSLISNKWSVYEGLQKDSLPNQVHQRLMQHLQQVKLFDILAEFINGKKQKLNEKLFDFIVKSAAISLYDDDKIILAKIEDRDIKIEIGNKLCELRNYEAQDSVVAGAQKTFDTILEAIFNKESNLELTAKEILLSQFLSSTAFITVSKLYASRIVQPKKVMQALRLGTVINKILKYMKFYKEELHKLSESMRYLMIHTQISIEHSFSARLKDEELQSTVKLMLTETFKLLLGLYGDMFEIVKKDTWYFYVEEFFIPGNFSFQSQFMHILSLCFNKRHERSLINIFVVQNLFQPLYKCLEGQLARQIQAEDEIINFPPLVHFILVIVTTLSKFEGASGMEGLTSQMRSSYFWKKLKEIEDQFDHIDQEEEIAYRYNIEMLLKDRTPGSAQSSSPNTRREQIDKLTEFPHSGVNSPMKRYSTHSQLKLPSFKFKGDFRMEERLM